MKYLIARDLKNRKLYKKYEKKQRILNSLLVNKYLDNALRIELKKCRLHVGFKSKIKNYCLITGRSRGIVRSYKISRMVFKEYASFGYLKGIRKASW